MKLCSVGAELSHVDGHDKGNSRFFTIFRTRLKTNYLCKRRLNSCKKLRWCWKRKKLGK